MLSRKQYHVLLLLIGWLPTDGATHISLVVLTVSSAHACAWHRVKGTEI